VKFIETGDGSFKVSGVSAFDGGVKLDCHNDYVIATVMLLATLCCKKSNSVIGYDAVEKLYPDFWQMYQNIGGFTEVIVQ
jgi:3-phosphoshikimate 1-carboxyvinyltransferase